MAWTSARGTTAGTTTEHVAGGTTSGSTAADRRATRRDLAVRAAVDQGLVGDRHPIAALLDVTGIRETAADLRSAFAEVAAPGQPVLHTFAVKAASLVPVLRLLAEEGIGCEVASPGELALARAAGVPAGRTVLDSPAKTPAELREALASASPSTRTTRRSWTASTPSSARRAAASPVGLRVNPQVGGGSIGAMSTATATSKFGVALRDDGAREWVVRAYRDRPWLTRLHSHVGSQGMPLELMAGGRRATYELAEEINAARRAPADRHPGHRRRPAGELHLGRG